MPSDYPLEAILGWLFLSLGAALLPEPRDRRLAGAGLLILGLGLAAWRAEPGAPGESLPSPRGMEAGFLVVNGGLLLGGLGATLWAAFGRGLGARRLPGVVAIAIGSGVMGWLSADLVLAAGPVRAVAAAVSLALGCAAVGVVSRRVASLEPARKVGEALFSTPVSPAVPDTRMHRIAAISCIAGAAAAALSTHVAVIALGVVVGAWSGYAAFRPGNTRSVPLAPALALVLALVVYRLLAVIAGPVGLSVGAFLLVPLSPAAQQLLALLLLAAAWMLSGLWPWHRQLAGGLTGLLGGLLLLRIALPLMSDGIELWRPLTVPLIVLGLWHALIRARWSLVAAGAGLLGLASATLAGAIGALWLYGAALALELGPLVGLSPSRARLMNTVAFVAAAWGGLMVVEGGLRGEVVYTAFGTLGLAIQAMMASVPSTPSAKD